MQVKVKFCGSRITKSNVVARLCRDSKCAWEETKGSSRIGNDDSCSIFSSKNTRKILLIKSISLRRIRGAKLREIKKQYIFRAIHFAVNANSHYHLKCLNEQPQSYISVTI